MTCTSGLYGGNLGVETRARRLLEPAGVGGLSGGKPAPAAALPPPVGPPKGRKLFLASGGGGVVTGADWTASFATSAAAAASFWYDCGALGVVEARALAATASDDAALARST